VDAARAHQKIAAVK